QVSAALYFNLGNACFKAGTLGRALAAYRQAEALAPRDPDLRANIQFARDQAQGPTLALSRWQKVLGRLSLNEWTILAGAAVWVAFLLLGAGQLWPAIQAPPRSTWVGTSLAALILGGACPVAFYETRCIRT